VLFSCCPWVLALGTSEHLKPCVASNVITKAVESKLLVHRCVQGARRQIREQNTGDASDPPSSRLLLLRCPYRLFQKPKNLFCFRFRHSRRILGWPADRCSLRREAQVRGIVKGNHRSARFLL
jgi:hypothetical protein